MTDTPEPPRRRRPDRWNEEREELLVRLWNEENRSGGECARLLGVTRSAVIGKVHRMGLNKRPRPKRARVAAARPRKARPAGNSNPRVLPPYVPKEPVGLSPPIDGGVVLWDAERHHCRAIVGYNDEKIALFCGHPVTSRLLSSSNKIIHTSFCEAHGDLYYGQSSSAV